MCKPNTYTTGSGHCLKCTSTVCCHGNQTLSVWPFSLLILYFFMWPCTLHPLSEWWHCYIWHLDNKRAFNTQTEAAKSNQSDWIDDARSYDLLHLAKRLCFWPYLFVCLMVCWYLSAGLHKNYRTDFRGTWWDDGTWSVRHCSTTVAPCLLKAAMRVHMRVQLTRCENKTLL